MILNENDCIVRIGSLTRPDWRPLLDLIPDIEKTANYGEWSVGTSDEDAPLDLPHCTPVPLVSKFLEVVYEIPIVVRFDWGSWDEGREIARNPNFNFDTIDLMAKCMLITAIVRNDRFCEGALVSAFQTGLILKILKSIKKEVDGLAQ